MTPASPVGQGTPRVLVAMVVDVEVTVVLTVVVMVVVTSVEVGTLRLCQIN